jgi:hypothetical protein
MEPAQIFDPLGTDFDSDITQEYVGQQPAAHADLATDAPHGKLNSFCHERLTPRPHVLVDTIDQGVVEIEQK